jgi:serine carboxypeptidase 1
MFWWMHYTIAETASVTDRPLILWLQGGPGSSSTGYGNFEILGPLDLELKERDFTWIKTHNVLFVDNPVGTGYSYVDHNKYLTKDNKQISRDLIELLRGFYVEKPEFRTVPLHIFGESYGGKMAVEFARDLHDEISRGAIEANLVTVAMGDAWISPIDSTKSWAPYLLQLVSNEGKLSPLRVSAGVRLEFIRRFERKVGKIRESFLRAF